MRYVIISKGLSISQLEAEVIRYGGRNLKVASRSKQVFCDMDQAGLEKLRAVPGLTVKPVQTVASQQLAAPDTEQEIDIRQPIYAGSQMGLSSMMYQLRESFRPPVVGQGWTIAVLDTGIRKTHRGLAGKVVYEANFTDSPTVSDVFSHGTAVAYVAAGGRHAPGEESGMAPGANLMNIKMLNDDGSGTVEDAVLAIEHVIELSEDASKRGLPPSDPMYPNVMNLSWGTEDDGDPDNPLRAALNEAFQIPIGIYAAAGNTGPGPGTVMLPASMPEVWGIGAMTFSPFGIWQYSARGPAKDGTIKPDLTFFGTDIVVASALSDTAFEIKSGTSFAAPAVCGGAILLAQAMHANGILPDEYARISPEEILSFVSLMCRKPQGEPAGKDNTYGMGQPFGDLAVKTLSGGGAAASSLVQAVTPVLTLGMVSRMMAGMWS